jgi:cyclophilin family peptidyl-prolyl cis-trans isomerase
MRKYLIAAICFGLTALSFAQGSSGSGTQAPHAPDAGTVPNKQSTAQAPPEPTATIQTSMGDIHCTLFPDKAPASVANFIGLATGKKQWTNPKNGQAMKGVSLYDGTTFHRVIPNFMIQGGDPLGTGSGGPGYSFNDEVSDLKFDQAGRLAMANSGPNTNGSQFYITEVPTPWLDGKYNLFGQCSDVELVRQIARVSRDERNDKPFTPVVIKHIVIVDPRHPAATKPAGTARKPGAATTKTTPKKTTTPPQ